MKSILKLYWLGSLSLGVSVVDVGGAKAAPLGFTGVEVCSKEWKMGQMSFKNGVGWGGGVMLALESEFVL